MTGEIRRWVVDASVGIQLFIPEDYSRLTEEFFRPLAVDSRFEIYVPDLFYAECANILWKQVRRSGYSASEAHDDILQLKGLLVRPIPTASLMPRALELALEWETLAYDACYVALAEALKAPLMTADQKLLKRLKGGPAQLKWIGDFAEK